jgi:hypothetical protein
MPRTSIILKLVSADGDGTRGLVDKLLALEEQEDAIRARMSEAPLLRRISIRTLPSSTTRKLSAYPRRFIIPLNETRRHAPFAV